MNKAHLGSLRKLLAGAVGSPDGLRYAVLVAEVLMGSYLLLYQGNRYLVVTAMGGLLLMHMWFSSWLCRRTSDTSTDSTESSQSYRKTLGSVTVADAHVGLRQNANVFLANIADDMGNTPDDRNWLRRRLVDLEADLRNEVMSPSTMTNTEYKSRIDRANVLIAMCNRDFEDVILLRATEEGTKPDSVGGSAWKDANSENDLSRTPPTGIDVR